MRTRVEAVIAASAQAIWAQKDHRHAFLGSSDAHSTRSTLAADLHPECSSWCSSKHGRTLRPRRKQCTRPASLLVVRSAWGCPGSELTSKAGLGHQFTRSDIGAVSHVEVGHVPIRCRRSHRIRELIVRMVPRAGIRGDGTVQRIGLEGWNGPAAVNQLSDLLRRHRDVGTRHEHRPGRRRRFRGQAHQSDADLDIVGHRRLCFTNGLQCAAINQRLMVSHHRERPWFATRLMPDERMHHLRVYREGTCGNERYEVHDGLPERKTGARRLLSSWRALALIATDPHRDESGLPVPLSTMMHSAPRICADNGAGRCR
jgi:hypothetical protein